MSNSKKVAAPRRNIGRGALKVHIGTIAGIIYGGAYFDRPEYLAGIKLAKEIPHECTIDLPIVDYSIPNPDQLRRALVGTLLLLPSHRELYAGCYGGIGRTGLFLAAMAKVQMALEHWVLRHRYRNWDGIKKYPENPFFSSKDVGVCAINFIRASYYPHAVETKEQYDYIVELDVLPVLEALANLKML